MNATRKQTLNAMVHTHNILRTQYSRTHSTIQFQLINEKNYPINMIKRYYGWVCCQCSVLAHYKLCVDCSE